MDQNKTPLLDAIVEYTRERPAYFKIPGHRYEKGISERWRRWTGDGIFRFDLTEAEGLDDLHCPEGVIREAQELAAEVFHARKSYFLVNGTTCGNEAMVMTCASEGEKIMVPRNAHKSVLMGLILSGAVPIWLTPRVDVRTGLCGSVSPQEVEQKFQEHPDCKGVFLVSPTYYGISSDIRRIGEICHYHQALLLVDEAHGGHLYFGDSGLNIENLPQGAVLLGADLCAQSMHKVTGSLTQSSLLHVGSSQVDLGRLESNLRLVQSTSPSYLLMTSLDAARYELALHGCEMLKKAGRLAEDGRMRLNQIPGIRCYGKEILGDIFYQLDTTRLVFTAEELGIGGYELAEQLYEKHRVGLELADDKNVVAIITYANEPADIDRLVAAVESVSKEAGYKKVHRTEAAFGEADPTVRLPADPPLPPYVLSPRQAYFSEHKTVTWEEAKGKIAAEALIPYPPGIPLVNPGERISNEIWSYMENYKRRRLHFHGPCDKHLNTIQIIPD